MAMRHLGGARGKDGDCQNCQNCQKLRDPVQGTRKLGNLAVFDRFFGGFRAKTATLKNPIGSFRGQNCHFFVKTAILEFR